MRAFRVIKGMLPRIIRPVPHFMRKVAGFEQVLEAFLKLEINLKRPYGGEAFL